MAVQTPMLVDLILSGDQDALAGYYDGRAPSVYAYCAEICPSQQVEEAVLASFADFLGRVRAAGSQADLDDLLRKSTRTAAASRMRVTNTRDVTCRSMPELIAARANGELPHDEGPINAHVEHCQSCRQTARRLIEAENALVGPQSRQPPEEVRTAWLLIASKHAERAGAPPDRAAEPPAPEPTSEPPAPSSPEPAAPTAAEPTPTPEAAEPTPPPEAAEPTPPPETTTPQPVRGRRRSGGLIGAARRVASSTRRR